MHSWRTLREDTLRPSELSGTSVRSNKSDERTTPTAPTESIARTSNEISSGIPSECRSLPLSLSTYLSPFSLSPSTRWARGETFAQFRVSRFTSDWHHSRRSLGRRSAARSSALSVDVVLPARSRPLARPETRASLSVTYRSPLPYRFQVIRT